MSEYAVHIHRLDETSPFAEHYFFPRFLFNEPVHLLSQPCADGFTFLLINTTRKRVEGRFNLFIQQLTGLSPCRAPFGGIEFNAHLPLEWLDFFIREIERFATSQRIARLHLTLYPFCYAPQQAPLLANRLLGHQYTLVLSELSFYLNVTDLPFKARLHPSEKGKLNASHRYGFVCKENEHPDLPKVYEMIRANRLRKCYPVSLDWEEFQELFLRFPEYCKVFTVSKGDIDVAAGVVIVVNNRILYTFYVADQEGYQRFSPVVLLTKSIYEYAQQKGFTLLDLGISTEKGIPNYGLTRFKQNLGAEPSLKLTFEKTL